MTKGAHLAEFYVVDFKKREIKLNLGATAELSELSADLGFLQPGQKIISSAFFILSINREKWTITGHQHPN